MRRTAGSIDRPKNPSAIPLSWNEIRSNAIAFAKEWEGESSEDAEAKSFWDDFFRVFGVPRRRVAIFEKLVEKANNKAGFIDLFWPKILIAEHKSRGKDLKRACTQAIDYFPGLNPAEYPRYVVVSDFARIRLTDLETDDEFEFPLEDLPKHVNRFGFIAGYEVRKFKEQDPVNIEAAEKLADLHDPLSMPVSLLKAHQLLDRSVDAAYGRKGLKTEAERVAFLFERYQDLATPLMRVAKASGKRSKKTATTN